MKWELNEPVDTLYNKGRLAMSDSQVLAAMGNISFDLAREILASVNFRLDELGKYTVDDFMKFRSIGIIKASSLVSAFEIGRRRMLEIELPVKRKINSSGDAFQILKTYFIDQPVEYCYAVYLNNINKVLHIEMISKGSMEATLMDPKVIFKKAFEVNAKSIIVAHNHPSGSTKPSFHDKEITKKLVDGGKFLNLPIVDHLIITDTSYLSFSDEGLL